MNEQNIVKKFELRWIVSAFLGLIVLTHGLIHLMYVTGLGDASKGELLGYSGGSYIADALQVDLQGLVTLLVSIVIIFSVIAALGLVKVPFLKRYVWKSMIVANISSLLCFAVMLGGLSPNDMAHVYGIVTSVVLLSFGFWGQGLEGKVAMDLPQNLRSMLFKVKA